MEYKFNDAMHLIYVKVRLAREVSSSILSLHSNGVKLLTMIQHTIVMRRGWCGGWPLESCMIKRYYQNSKVGFIEWLLDQICFMRLIKCWKVKKFHVQKMHVVEMRKLRWMCGHTKSYKIKIEDIQNKDGVTSVVDKMRKLRLRWLEHVKRRRIDTLVRRYTSWL